MTLIIATIFPFTALAQSGERTLLARGKDGTVVYLMDSHEDGTLTLNIEGIETKLYGAGIKTDKSSIYAWTMTSPYSNWYLPEANLKISYDIYDCTDNTITNLTTAIYGKTGIISRTDLKSKALRVIPGSIDQSIHNRLCDFWRAFEK